MTEHLIEESHVDIKQMVCSTCTCRYVRGWLRITLHLGQDRFFFLWGILGTKHPL